MQLLPEQTLYTITAQHVDGKWYKTGKLSLVQALHSVTTLGTRVLWRADPPLPVGASHAATS